VLKRVLFLLSRQHGLSATYPAPISTIFETTDVNRFAHAYTRENFSNFCTGGKNHDRKKETGPKYNVRICYARRT